MIWILDKTK